MNKRIKKLWIEALTSGKYKQGKGQLRDGDKFCCLGVLCDLHRNEVGGRWAIKGQAQPQYLDSAEWLPEPVQEWAGLEQRNPELKGEESHPRLSWKNDGGTSFSAIAELIETYL
jgi:hypothetical protein